MKAWKCGIALLLCIVIMTSTASAAFSSNELDALIKESTEGLSAMGGEPGVMLADRELFPAGNSLNDWIAHALSLGGSREYYAEYLDALRSYVEKEYAANGGLHEIKATEYHRIALTVMSLGGDPTSFGVKPDGTPIDLIADGTYNFIGRDLGLQGLNGWIWALITLDASGVEVPMDAKYQRMDMVNAIISAQEPDGGFGLDIGRSNIDITAMALQALSPYIGLYKTEIYNALNWLSFQMNDDCTYDYFDSTGSESISQVIMALCALEIDPESQSAFIRGDHTLLTALDSFRQPDGTYAHLADDGEGNGLATCQAIQALISLQNYHRGLRYVFASGYNMPAQNTDELPVREESTPVVSEQAPALAAEAAAQSSGFNYAIVIVILLAAAILAACIILLKRRGKSSVS